MDFSSCDRARWKDELEAYDSRLESLAKPKAKADLVSLDSFYRKDLPLLLCQRDPDPFLNKPELLRLMKWKLSRGKWRPRLLDFVSSLGEKEVELASKKAFASLPDLSKAISNLTVLKGVGPATASAILAVYAPDIAPFMSDEALMAAMESAKEYTLKQYIPFAEKLQKKAKVEQLLSMVDEGYGLLGMSNWFDNFPLLAGLDLQRIKSRCSDLMPKVNQLVNSIIDEHRSNAGLRKEQDFIDILLSLQESEGLSDSDIAAVQRKGEIQEAAPSGRERKELSGEGECFTASDVERALWSSVVGSKSLSSSKKIESEAQSNKSAKRKRKH